MSNHSVRGGRTYSRDKAGGRRQEAEAERQKKKVQRRSRRRSKEGSRQSSFHGFPTSLREHPRQLQMLWVSPLHRASCAMRVLFKVRQDRRHVGNRLHHGRAGKRSLSPSPVNCPQRAARQTVFRIVFICRRYIERKLVLSIYVFTISAKRTQDVKFANRCFRGVNDSRYHSKLFYECSLEITVSVPVPPRSITNHDKPYHFNGASKETRLARREYVSSFSFTVLKHMPGSAVMFSGLSAPVTEEFLLSITRCVKLRAMQSNIGASSVPDILARGPWRRDRSTFLHEMHEKAFSLESTASHIP